MAHQQQHVQQKQQAQQMQQAPQQQQQKQQGTATSWKCECGWENKLWNVVCGGLVGKASGMGCGRPLTHYVGAAPGGRATDIAVSWKCTCGWDNKLWNAKCGGVGGMGCGLPRPASAIAGGAGGAGAEGASLRQTPQGRSTNHHPPHKRQREAWDEGYHPSATDHKHQRPTRGHAEEMRTEQMRHVLTAGWDRPFTISVPLRATEDNFARARYQDGFYLQANDEQRRRRWQEGGLDVALARDGTFPDTISQQRPLHLPSHADSPRAHAHKKHTPHTSHHPHDRNAPSFPPLEDRAHHPHNRTAPSFPPREELAHHPHDRIPPREDRAHRYQPYHQDEHRDDLRMLDARRLTHATHQAIPPPRTHSRDDFKEHMGRVGERDRDGLDDKYDLRVPVPHVDRTLASRYHEPRLHLDRDRVDWQDLNQKRRQIRQQDEYEHGDL